MNLTNLSLAAWLHNEGAKASVRSFEARSAQVRCASAELARFVEAERKSHELARSLHNCADYVTRFYPKGKPHDVAMGRRPRE